MVYELCDWIIQLNEKIKVLHLANNNISSSGARILFDTLKTSNLRVSKVNLFGNNLDDECMTALGEYVGHNEFIEDIRIGRNKISNKGIEILSSYLIGNKNMRVLDFHENKQIDDKSIQYLNDMINASCIENVDIKATLATKENMLVVPLVLNMLKNKSEVICFDYREIKDNDIDKFSKGIKNFGCERLKELDLHGNEITSTGALALFDALTQMKSILVSLNLHRNKLGDESMESLGKLILNSEFIEYLNVGSNNITDKGMETFLNKIIGNMTLKNVDLSWNRDISDESGENLLLIAKSTCITEINLFGTFITQETIKNVNEYLSLPIDSREIPVLSNSKSAAKHT